MKLPYLLCFFCSLTGCVTSGPNHPEFKESRVIERAPGYDETPKFAHKSGMSEEGQDAVFVMLMTFSGNARPEACIDGASTKARGQMGRYITEGITSSGQLNETSASEDPAVESLTAFISNNKLHGIKTIDEYWEKFETSDEQGSRVLKLRCAVKIGIQKSLLANQLKQAINGAPQGNPEIRKQLLDAQKNFIESIGNESQTGHIKGNEQTDAH